MHEIKHFIKLEAMKILHNEVSRYEPVTGPRGAHFPPPPPPPWPAAWYILPKVRLSAEASTNKSQAEEHLKERGRMAIIVRHLFLRTPPTADFPVTVTAEARDHSLMPGLLITVSSCFGKTHYLHNGTLLRTVRPFLGGN